MVDVDTIDAEAGLLWTMCQLVVMCVGTRGETYDAPPRRVLQIALVRATHALGPVQAEETAVDLANDALCIEKIKKEPALPEGMHICAEDGECEGAEAVRLVDCNQHILNRE
jgi:hypothetical protein